MYVEAWKLPEPSVKASVEASMKASVVSMEGSYRGSRDGTTSMEAFVEGAEASMEDVEDLEASMEGVEASTEGLEASIAGMLPWKLAWKAWKLPYFVMIVSGTLREGEGKRRKEHPPPRIGVVDVGFSRYLRSKSARCVCVCAKSTHSLQSVSYTHLTLPTILLV